MIIKLYGPPFQRLTDERPLDLVNNFRPVRDFNHSTENGRVRERESCLFETFIVEIIKPLGGYAHGLYVEKWVAFVKELSVIVARGRDNTMLWYPVVEKSTSKMISLVFKYRAMVLLNEVAPRPHNSGHPRSIEACFTSQNEMHLRDVIGLPLGDPLMKIPAAIMYNIRL